MVVYVLDVELDKCVLEIGLCVLSCKVKEEGEVYGVVLFDWFWFFGDGVFLVEVEGGSWGWWCDVVWLWVRFWLKFWRFVW